MSFAFTPVLFQTITPPTYTFNSGCHVPPLELLPIPTFQPALDVSAKKYECTYDDDKLAAANILFRSKAFNDSTSVTRLRQDPLLDYELNCLKRLFLSQSAIGSSLSQDMTPLPLHLSSTSSLPQVYYMHVRSPERAAYGQSNSASCKEIQEIKEKMIGNYTPIERQRKIKKYKDKLGKWRAEHPINRKFNGRRKVAFLKQRFNGRFSKSS